MPLDAGASEAARACNAPGPIDVTTADFSPVTHRSAEAAPDANATVHITHELFLKMLTGNAGIKDTLFSDDVSLEGSSVDLLRFFALLDTPDEVFGIVTP